MLRLLRRKRMPMFSAAVSQFLASTVFSESIKKNENRSGGMDKWQKEYQKLQNNYHKWQWTSKIPQNLEQALLTLTTFKEKTEGLEGTFILSMPPRAKEYFDLMNRIIVKVGPTTHGDSYGEPSSYGVSFFDPVTGNREYRAMSGYGGHAGVNLFRDLPKSFLSEEGFAKRGEFFDFLFGPKGSGGPSL